MTVRQVFAYFSVDRDDDGRPKWPDGSDDGSERDYYFDFLRRQCGVWDAAEREALWRRRKGAT